jgi:hypothetical protein
MYDDRMRWVSGFATGVVALVCAELIAWGVMVAASYRELYREFQGQLPAVTRVALSPLWIAGLAGGVGLAAAALNLYWRGAERARAIALAALAIVAIGLAIGTAWAAAYPLTQVAGNISAE